MNYIEAVKRLAFIAGEGRGISVGMLMGARAVDRIYPDRLTAHENILLFDGQVFDFWEIVAPAFDYGVSFETPRGGLFDMVIMSEDLADSPFVTNWKLSDIAPNLFGIGGYVESAWVNTVYDFKTYYYDKRIGLKFHKVFDLVNILADSGIITLFEIDDRWNDYAEDTFRMFQSEANRAAIIGEMVRRASHSEQQTIESVQNVLETIQPSNLVGNLFSAWGFPLLILAGGIGVLFATKAVAESSAIKAAK